MRDVQTYLEKLQRDAIDCALISKRATDPQKKALFDRLADHLAILASELERAIDTNALSVPVGHATDRARGDRVCELSESAASNRAGRRATVAAGMTVTPTGSVTVGVTPVTAGVTAVVTVTASASRRIRPASSHAFNRRPARILFQPHWRASSAALAATRPSGRERSQASASASSNGRIGTMSVITRGCSWGIGQHTALMRSAGRSAAMRR